MAYFYEKKDASCSSCKRRVADTRQARNEKSMITATAKGSATRYKSTACCRINKNFIIGEKEWAKGVIPEMVHAQDIPDHVATQLIKKSECSTVWLTSMLTVMVSLTTKDDCVIYGRSSLNLISYVANSIERDSMDCIAIMMTNM
jgi:hypothetical protein